MRATEKNRQTGIPMNHINPFVSISNRLSCRRDARLDRKICGMELGAFVPTPYGESHGATGSQSAPYLGLGVVLKDLKATPEDSIIDIGCGKGRILAYLASLGLPCKITGIEINPEVCEVAKAWTSRRHPDIEVIEGDAYGLDFDDYTIMIMYRPMETDTFIGFIEQLENSLTHNIKLYYYADGQSGYVLNDRPGWNLIERHDIYRVKGYYIHKVPQRYSVWEYRC